MKRFVPVAIAALLLQGCTAVGLTLAATGAGVAATAGIDHTLSGITYKTFNAPVDELRLAALKTLDRLDMKVTEDRMNDEGRQIVATAHERVIEIEFEALTRRTTRMRVVANRGAFFKDAATATEIILQTAETLDFDMDDPEPKG